MRVAVVADGRLELGLGSAFAKFSSSFCAVFVQDEPKKPSFPEFSAICIYECAYVPTADDPGWVPEQNRRGSPLVSGIAINQTPGWG